MNPRGEKLKAKILNSVAQYFRVTHSGLKKFAPGDRINYAGRVYGEEEVKNLVDSALEFWLTTGRYADRLEQDLAEYAGVKYCSLVNSGSSANLLAFAALTQKELSARRIIPGDEVITTALCFPTTVAPIVQHGAVPVFVDAEPHSYNIDCALLEKALSKKTKAVFLAHTMGNPFDVARVKRFCGKHKLWLIEDNCDALGSEVFSGGRWRKTGSFGDISTSSFYPAHHMTTGEGGAVYTDNPLLKRLVESLRDWGRDCWCKSGRDNSCGCRFSKQFGSLPLGYDHKYVYSRLGYNLKMTDMQAAVGCAQIKRLPAFVGARRRNWEYFRKRLAFAGKFFLLPSAERGFRPSWFGFLITVRPEAGFARRDIVAWLESRGVQTRTLFSGNITRHPCFDGLRPGKDYKIAGRLAHTDAITKNTFWLGVYPGLARPQLDYIAALFAEFLSGRR